MNHQIQQEAKRELAADKREDMIKEEYENISNDQALMEAVIVKYASDLANAWLVRRDSQLLTDILVGCIEREAEGNVDNELSRGE